MRIIKIPFVALAAAGLLAACAVEEKTGAADTAPTITLSKLVVDENLDAGVRYEVTLPYEVSGEGSISVRKACFRWSGEGPYCFDARHDKGSKTVKVRLRTRNPNIYRLAGYVEYTSNGSAKKSNVVAQMINVE